MERIKMISNKKVRGSSNAPTWLGRISRNDCYVWNSTDVPKGYSERKAVKYIIVYSNDEKSYEIYQVLGYAFGRFIVPSLPYRVGDLDEDCG